MIKTLGIFLFTFLASPLPSNQIASDSTETPICIWNEFDYVSRQISRIDPESWLIDFTKPAIKHPNTYQTNKEFLKNSGQQYCSMSRHLNHQPPSRVAEVNIIQLGLVHVPNGLCEFSSVHRLRLLFNAINSFSMRSDSDQIECMSKVELKGLELRYNKIREIDLTLVSMIPSLEELYLDYNFITKIGPISTFGKVNLRVLSLKFNWYV